MVGMEVGQLQSSATVEMAMHMGRMQVEHTVPRVDMTVGHCLMVLVTVGAVVGVAHLDVESAQVYDVVAQPGGQRPPHG
jgi:hypothetical protein